MGRKEGWKNGGKDAAVFGSPFREVPWPSGGVGLAIRRLRVPGHLPGRLPPASWGF